jgi:hypothetical protein
MKPLMKISFLSLDPADPVDPVQEKYLDGIDGMGREKKGTLQPQIPRITRITERKNGHPGKQEALPNTPEQTLALPPGSLTSPICAHL